MRFLRNAQPRFTAASPDRNAMFWKDTTQWLRTGLFAGIFFGLLLLGEGVSLLTLINADEGDTNGRGIFATLEVILGVYLVIIAVSGAQQTFGEIKSGTFQLYALTGLSQSEVVKGKLISLMAQFLFGYCCLAPFMFFSYLMGGVDFYQILGALVSFIFWGLPLFCIALMLGFKHPDTTFFGTMLRAGCLFILLIFCSPLIGAVLEGLSESGILTEGIGPYVIKGLVALDITVIGISFFSLFVYTFLFYLLYGFCVIRLVGAVPAFAILDPVPRYRGDNMEAAIRRIASGPPPEDTPFFPEGSPPSPRLESAELPARPPTPVGSGEKP